MSPDAHFSSCWTTVHTDRFYVCRQCTYMVYFCDNVLYSCIKNQWTRTWNIQIHTSYKCTMVLSILTLCVSYLHKMNLFMKILFCFLISRSVGPPGARQPNMNCFCQLSRNHLTLILSLQRIYRLGIGQSANGKDYLTSIWKLQMKQHRSSKN